MGADGGTINKKTHITLHDPLNDGKIATDDNRRVFAGASVWKCCRLSNMPLEEPIVSDNRGRIFNKIEIIKWLLSKDKHEFSDTQQEEFQDIKRLDDIVELRNITVIKDDKTTSDVSVRCNFGDDILSESKKFVYLVKCGCVLPKVSISRQLSTSNEHRCPSCHQVYSALDIVSINPGSKSKEFTKMYTRMDKLREMKLHHNGTPVKSKKRTRAKTKDHETKKQKVSHT